LPMVSHSQAQGKKGQGIASAKAVFWVMFGINFLNYLDRYVFTGAANVMGKELGFNLSGIGSISSAFLIVYTIFTIPFGVWADRAKRKDVIAICVAVWSVITALTALASNVAGLFISRMLLGVGEAGYYPAGTALLSDYFSRSRRSRIMSWWNIGPLIGILGGYALGGAFAGLSRGGWRLAFLFTGIPGLVLAYLAWRVREPRRNQADEEAIDSSFHTLVHVSEVEEPPHAFMTPGSVFSQFWSLLRVKTLAVLIVMQVFAYFVLGVNTVFLPTYLQQKDIFGLTSGQAGLYTGVVIVLAGGIGTMLGGYMADVLNRWHQGARVLVCGIGFLLGAPSFAVAVTFHDLRVFTLFFVLTTILLTFYNGPSTAAAQDVVPSVLRASAIAIVLLIAHLLGDALAPTLVGVIATAFDPTHGAHFRAGVAGHDLSTALLITCTPALVIAGLIGIFGARWMATDVAAAEEADRRLKKEKENV
jgi:MFS transporter, Spinster family, sphingosine-1-phosphate transporter